MYRILLVCYAVYFLQDKVKSNKTITNYNGLDFEKGIALLLVGKHESDSRSYSMVIAKWTA